MGGGDAGQLPESRWEWGPKGRTKSKNAARVVRAQVQNGNFLNELGTQTSELGTQTSELGTQTSELGKQANSSNLLTRPSALIVYGLIITTIFQQCTGWCIPFGGSEVPDSWRPSEPAPAPEQGEYFTTGAEAATSVAAALPAAPPKTWNSSAADAYAEATATLVALAHQTADLDQQMQSTVHAHSDVVTQARFILGLEQDFLIMTLAAVLYLELAVAEWAEFTALWWFALGVALGAIGVGAWQLGVACDASRKHAATVQSMDYDGVIEAAQRVSAAYPATHSAP